MIPKRLTRGYKRSTRPRRRRAANWGTVVNMRTHFAYGMAAAIALSAACLVPVACGGGRGVSNDAKSPDAPGAASASPGGGPADDAGPTTTLALGDAGDLQGAKLTESHVVAATSASAGPAPKGPHSHDPGRSPEDIRAIVIAHRDEARGCYEKSLKDHPGIEGDLVIQWTIDPKGNVTQVSLDTARSQVLESTVVACVGNVIKRIQFAPSPGGFATKASYPFNFHPRGNPTPSDR